MTTLTINKENAQSIIQIIMKRLEQGDMLIDLYDDTDVGIIPYENLSADQQKKYDEVDLIDTALYSDV